MSTTPVVRVRLLPGRVERDRFAGGSDEGEIQSLKRFKGVAEARTGNGAPERFEVILDLRARILSVGRVDPNSNASPAMVGEGIVQTMGRFLMIPLRSFATRLPDPSNGRSEWLVSDADQALGLLHRVHECKEVAVEDERPNPPALAPLLEGVAVCVHDALKLLEKANQDIMMPRRGWIEPFLFDTAHWQAVEQEVLFLLEDRELAADLVRFHQNLNALDEDIRTIRQHHDPKTGRTGLEDAVGPEHAARSHLGYLLDPTQRVGRRVLQNIATPEQRQKWRLD